MLLNVRSLNRDKVDLLCVDTMNYSNLKFICLTESGDKPELLKAFHISGFSLSTFFCRSVHERGGVAIWVNSNLTVEPIDLSCFCIEKHIEVSAILWKKSKDSFFLILTCYRSPSGDLKIFLNALYAILEKLYKPGIKIVVCGDFNADAYKASDFRSLSKMLENFNLQPQVKWPTRVTSTSCTLIDNIFTNFAVKNTPCVIDSVIADHRAVLFEFVYCENVVNDKICYLKRNFSDTAVIRFKTGIRQHNWSVLYTLANLNEAFNYFYETYVYYFELFFPLRKHTTMPGGRGKEWISKNVRVSSERMNDFRNLKCSFPELGVLYDRAKQEHTKLIKDTKRQYYQSKIEKSDNLNKTAWVILDEVTGKDREVNKNINLKLNDVVEDDPIKIACSFNAFFQKAPLEVVKQISKKEKRELRSQVNLYNSLFLRPFTTEEIMSILFQKIKNKKSSGPDEIPSFLVKATLLEIAEQISFLVNLSFTSGEFPSALKLGKVIPIFKKHDSLNIENYRPVTICSIFSKVFEYCFLDRLINFLDENKILNDNQHGFRGGKSTMSAMMAFQSNILECVERGECPVGIFCDLSRAFDCVDHSILLKKLFGYGIRGAPHDWVSSFLKCRLQYVSIPHFEKNFVNKVKSDNLQINIGVPQGSVLGPILFLLYVNDLDSISTNASLTLYADDTSLSISDDCCEILEQKCNSVAKEMDLWFSSNALYLNPNKTNVMRFHNRQKRCDRINVSVDGIPLPNASESVKFLGVWFDECLNWRTHCTQLVSKLHSLCYLFRNLKAVFQKKQLISFYHALVESRIRYGICLWGNSTTASDVFVAQKRIMRCIAGVSNTYSCRELFKTFKILTLSSLFIYELCVYIHSSKNTLKLNRDVNNLNTRISNDIYVPFRRCNMTRNGSEWIGVKVYNHLPRVLKDCKTLLTFKARLKEFLFNNVFYDLSEYGVCM